MKLQLRLSLAISALIFLLSGGFIMSLYLVERSYLRGQAEAERADALSKLATVCRDSFLSRDEIGLLNYMRHVAETPGIVSAAFLDNGNRILMHSNVALKGSTLSLPWTENITPGRLLHQRTFVGTAKRDMLEYAAPVESDGVRLGIALLHYDAASADATIAQALRNTLRRFAGVAAICLLAGVLVAQYTAYAFVKPIRTLTGAVGRIGGGDFSTLIRNERNDEIGQLSRDFDHMATRLHQLDELKSQFIQAVSHDLRNPLYAVVMTCEYMLAQNSLGSREVELTNTICASAKELAKMVTDILDLSKMQAGKMIYHKEDTDLAEIIRPLSGLYAAMLSAKELTMTQNFPDFLPRVRVDRRMISRVFSNLVSNAVKFSKKGDRIEIGARPGDGSDRTTFYVADSGIGISAEELPYVFGRFHQVAQTDPEMKDLHGTGLGLTICKSIVEDHGGRIWVESIDGRGSTFFFSLPKTTSLSEHEKI